MVSARTGSLLSDPNLASIMQLAFEAFGSLIHVAMPGKVLKYDENTRFAEVQPLLKYHMEGQESPRAFRPIPRVPVIHPSAAAGSVILPVAAGDIVTLLFSDKSLSTWKPGSGEVSFDKDARQHDMTDCWAIPGGFPERVAQNNAPRFPGAFEIRLASGTKFAIGNGTNEIVDLMDQLLELLAGTLQLVESISTHTHTETGATTSVPDNSAVFVSLQSEIAAVQTKLQEFLAN